MPLSATTNAARGPPVEARKGLANRQKPRHRYAILRLDYGNERTMMTCFIIMPYSSEYDDRHASIRRAARRVTDPCSIKPHRLDDEPAAGRIPARLERSIREADFCVADISPPLPAHPSFSNSNVMWEVGYAMALGKVPILIAANEVRLPFDVHDLQHIRYDRNDLAGSLEGPLARSMAATARDVLKRPRLHGSTEAEGMLREIIRVLEASPTVHESVAAALAPKGIARASGDGMAPAQLVGAWRNIETDSFAYVAQVGGRVFAPYCYAGNDHLSGIYYDWAPMNGWFYARFMWVHAPIRGFSFLRPEGANDMKGAWWYDGEANDDPNARPDTHTGWQSHWSRMPGAPTPAWAQRLIDAAQEKGLDAVLASIGRSKGERRGRKWQP